MQQGVGNPGELWKALNDIFPSKSSCNPLSIVVNKNVLSRNDDIANGFNDHFANVANVLIKDDFIARSTSKVYWDYCSNVTQSKLNLSCVSHDFVNNGILHMSTKKATGLNDIDLLLWTVLLSL